MRSLALLKEKFSVPVGLSDHTIGVTTAVAAVALGASLVEKHFTLSRASGAVDSAFSLEPDEFRQLCEMTSVAWRALGSAVTGAVGSEKEGLKFRRSLYAVKSVKRGEVFTGDNVRSIRPGKGLHPRYLDTILGKKALRDIPWGSPITSDMFSPENT